MLIGEVVKKTGFSRDTIRFYEKKGLLTVGRTDSEWNNYKEYDDQALRRLFLIKKCKEFGFTLNEIREILDLVEVEKATCMTMSDTVKKKLSHIDQKIKELEQMKKMIKDKFEISSKICNTNTETELNCGVLTVANRVDGREP